jgi:phosphate acyltransferase
MQPVRLAIDAASGDHGYPVVVKGVLDAHRLAPGRFVARLCGNRAEIERTLIDNGTDQNTNSGAIEIEHCPDTVTAVEHPSRVWKNRPQSSIVRCVALQHEGVVEASISAGDTGILMPASLFLLGRGHGISRPALAAFLPTTGKQPVLVLDVGANLDCRVDHLADFGVMGSEYYSRFFGIDSPRVSLLNIGREPNKGTRTIAEAGRVLERRCRGYIGFIEGSQVLGAGADVVVCDGFVGNVLLKSCESFYRLAESVLGGKDAAVLETIQKNMTIFNSENYGAAPILGVQGVVFKAHGDSSARAIAQAIAMTVTAVRQQVIRQTA